MTNIISAAKLKGGVGRTSTCAKLGIGLSQQGERALLINTDLQESGESS